MASMEVLVLRSEFSALFTPAEIEIAGARLAQHDPPIVSFAGER
jgi:hypothetical protein